MKKFIFILFCISPIYAMEDEKIQKTLTFSESNISESVQKEFEKAIEYANQKPSPEAFKKIENYLNLGVNINSQIGLIGKTPLIYAVNNLNKSLFNFLLQKGANINTCDNFKRTPLYIALINQNSLINFNIEEDFLKRGANPNTKKEGKSLIHIAIDFGNIDSIKTLIKYGAKINEKDNYQYTPLEYAIVLHSSTAISELCNLGASLIDIGSNNSNAFHVAVQEKFSKPYIKLLIINSRFDSYNKEIDNQLKTTIKIAFLVFNRLKPVLPKEIQLIILSHLALNCLYTSFNKKLCQQLVGHRNAKDPLLAYTLNKVNCLEQILQSKNNQNKTALQLLDDVQVLCDLHPGDCYIQEVESLVDVKNLQQDRIDFMQGLAREDNLVVQIYEHAKKLLFES